MIDHRRDKDHYYCYYDNRYLQFIDQIWQVSNVQRTVGTDDIH